MIPSIVIGCVLLFANVVVGQEETQCRGVNLNLTDREKATTFDCLKEAGIKSVWKIPAEKLACFGVCILQRKDMLTADGKIHHEKVLKYIARVMRPEEVKKPLISGIDKCIVDHGEKVKGKEGEDPTCITFMEVGQCIHGVFLEICLD